MLWFLVLGGLGCTSADAKPPSVVVAPTSPPTTVILISLDGTRPVDVNEEQLPSLVAVAREGAISEGLVPVNPSNTFPNHVSMATGVRPEVHRLVNNRFVDPERGRFTRDAIHEWIESEPIWSIAERNGVRAASYFWVGSEGPWSAGPGPSETRKFSSRTSEKTKVDRILKWLAIEDPSKRPRLILSWFHGADHEAHETGPGTPAVAESLAQQDQQIARLIREMEAGGLFATTTLMFVSDHGMVEATQRVNLARALGRAGLDCSVLGIGGFASVFFDEGARTPANVRTAIAVAKQAGLEAWPRDGAPSDWHVDDVRFGDIVVRAPVGTAIVGRTTAIAGFHGYDPNEPSMAGLLVARGRGVVPGAKLGRISNLAIAPTVLRLLDLPIPPQMQVPPVPSLISGLETTDDRVETSPSKMDAGSGMPTTDLPADLPNDLHVEEQGT
jgi:predicted AlkP superfamily pyrophosphatase or phosphodiesterase